MLGTGLGLHKTHLLGGAPSQGLFFKSGTIDGNRLVSTKNGTDDRLLVDRYVNHLDGSTEYGSVPDNTDLDIPDHLSVVVQAKNDSTIPASNQAIIAKYGAFGSFEWRFCMANGQDIEIGLSSNGSGQNVWRSTNSVTTQNLHTYAFTFDGGTALKVYVDGVEVAGTFTSGSLPSSLFASSADLTVGARGATSNYWDGIVYQALILDGTSAVPTDAEMLDIHNSMTANPTKDIQNTAYGLSGQTVAAHYKLDENTGTTFFDASGNGNDGTWQNSPTIETTVDDVINYQNNVGYTDNAGLRVPRDESDITNDAQGNPLGNTGKAKPYAYVEGNSCISLDGSTEEGSVGDVSNVDKFEGYVKLGTDNQVLFSLANSTATAISVSAGVLTAGGSLTLGTIQIGDSSDSVSTVSAATAGSTLNDNAWHYLVVNFTSFDATDLQIGTDGTSHGNIDLAGIIFSLSGSNVVFAPISEGGLDRSFDVSGNGNDIVWQNSPTWSTQDVYAYNWGVGFNKYLRASTAGYVAVTSPSTDSIYSVKMDFYTPSDITSATSGASWFEGNNTANTFAWYFGSFTGALTNEVIGVISPGNRRTGVLNITITAGWHSVEARWNGSYYDIYLDDVMQTVTAAGAGHTLQETASDRLRFGTAAGATGFTGIMANMVVKSDSSTEILNVLAHGEEGIADTSPNAYSLSTSGIVNQRIPKLSTADTDVFGETLRNIPVDGHNDAESTLDFKNISDTNASIPETQFMAASTNFTALGFDVDTGWDTYDYAFYRQKSSLANDRFLLYSQGDLTGTELAKAENYTGN